MAKSKIILANLKAFRPPKKVAEWLDALLSALPTAPRGVEIVLALPDMVLADAAAKIRGHANYALAAQSVSPFPQGGYTGSTPAAWLKGLTRYTLCGHRERRQYFRETNQDVARQISEALAEEIAPIVCVDSANFGFAQQLAALSRAEQEKVIWAYTPKVELPLNHEDFTTIAKSLAHMERQSDGRPVLYGGGVNAENIHELWAMPGLSGLMLASAVRDAAEFASLLQKIA